MKKSLFEIQVNGFAGVDFQSRELSVAEIRRAVGALEEHETRRFFATFITDDLVALEARLVFWERVRADEPAIAAAVAGYHLEGPWISPEPGYRGAHDPAFVIPPRLPDFDRLQEAAGGRVKIVTLAPEVNGAHGFIAGLRSRGVQVSIGHSNAGWDSIRAAIEAGAGFCTHLGNGVPAMLDRHDNVVQRLLSCDELVAFFIPDGIHLPPHVLQNFFRAKLPGKALFTTDCMAAAGSPPGRYRLAHHEMDVGADGVVRMPGSSQFAGSSLTPPRAVENAVRWLGLPPAEARRLHSTAVAAFFGVDLPDLP